MMHLLTNERERMMHLLTNERERMMHLLTNECYVGCRPGDGFDFFFKSSSVDKYF
jgi:hypothetical protein